MKQTGTFDEQLRETKDDLLAMGIMVEKALGQSIDALKKRDLNLAHQVMADVAQINTRRFQIEDKAIALIATQQTAAINLRFIVAILDIVTELERIGEYAEGIAKIVIMIGSEPPLKPLIDIPRMSEIAIGMIQDSLKSFMEADATFAKKVASMDSVVDSLYAQVFRELLTFMMSDPKTINRATRLIWVAHNLERAADRATNICERVVYTVSGKMENIRGSGSLNV